MINTENLKTLKYNYHILDLFIACSKDGNEYKKIFKEEESAKLLKNYWLKD